MRLRAWLAVGLGVALLVAWSILRDRSTSSAAAALRATVAARDDSIRRLLLRATRTDTQFRLDTAALAAAIAKYIPARVRIETVLKHDSTHDTVRVATADLRDFRNACDSAIAAAARALTTCETRVSQRDSVIAFLHAQVHDEHQIGLLSGRPRRFVPWVGVGYGIVQPGLVGSAGLELAVLGRLSAAARGDIQAGQPTRVVAGVRFTF